MSQKFVFVFSFLYFETHLGPGFFSIQVDRQTFAIEILGLALRKHFRKRKYKNGDLN